MAQPAQLEAKAVGIEMFGKAWKSGRVMRSHEPSSHRIATREQVCDPSVDVIPGHPTHSPLFEGSLVVGIQLTQIVESGCYLDVCKEVRRRPASEAKHPFGALPGSGSNTLNMPLVIICLAFRLRRRMS